MAHMILLLAASAMILGLAGCGMTPDMQLLPEQVLAGDWLTTTNTGEDAIVTFDDMGAILSVLVESSDGSSVLQKLSEHPRFWIGTLCSSRSRQWSEKRSSAVSSQPI